MSTDQNDSTTMNVAPLEEAREHLDLRRLNRTPRPYFRDGHHVNQDGCLPPSSEMLADMDGAAVEPSESEICQQDEIAAARSQWQRQSGQISVAGSESGTEADDERRHFVRTLPPAMPRLRKGLKTGEKNEDVLLTPSQLDDEGRMLKGDPWGPPESSGPTHQLSEEEARAEAELLQRRRLGEFLRRISEVGLMGVMTACVLCGAGVAAAAWQARDALLCYLVVIVGLVLAYPFKLSLVDTRATHNRVWERFRVPASFDPATVLYPPLLPVLVALSVSAVNPEAILPNIVLGLSALPQRLFPRSSRLGGFNALHWLVSVLPVIVSLRASANTFVPSSVANHLTQETLVSLYPLHHALLLPLLYITKTSLLISELHLLSTALINLLLLANSPQLVILKACLWVGGATIFVVCGPVLRWNLTLARVPKWKLRRPGHTTAERKSFVDAVSALINLQRATGAFSSGAAVDSDADEDEPVYTIKDKVKSLPKITTNDLQRTLHGPKSAVEPRRCNSGKHRTGRATISESIRPRRNTVPERDSILARSADLLAERLRKQSSLHWCLQLTAEQAKQRKWLYAGYFYMATILIVLGPVQRYVSRKALVDQNPILWAVLYMFGQVPFLRQTLHALAVDSWVSWPPAASLNVLDVQHLSLVPLTWPLDIPHLRGALGPANVRLLLVAYWAVVLLLGLLTVFSLTAYVEVDTRRKVFHGVMVAMLMPSIFIDPCCCALALALGLTVFLLLEVVRAGQVPPLGNSIGRFVAPYVDGRDLRGPVVVSHIFLLIGCAIPLWFSLASLPREAGLPWSHWDLAGDQREVALVAGVVCVGMGDAAASLIGRRYGKHKWPWVGGKSLEGSAAFAFAVTLGLAAAKLWQVSGCWTDGPALSSLNSHVGQNGALSAVYAWSVTIVKAAFCACGASFMEAVLTGANDNVVVPIALWLFVKGCRI